MFSTYKDEYVEYISKADDLKPRYSEMSAMVMKVNPNKSKRNMADEILQALQFQLINYKAWLLTSSADNKIYLIWHNLKNTAPYYDMGQYFSADELNFELCAPMNKSVDKFCSILEKSIPLNDNHAFSGLKRMQRNSNIFFIYSSDTSRLRDISKYLQPYGNVVTMSSKDTLISLYRQYVPNILFMDDLDYTQDCELKNNMYEVRSILDRYSKIVILSEKSNEARVKLLLECGISGYLLLPLSPKSIFTQLSRLNLLKKY